MSFPSLSQPELAGHRTQGKGTPASRAPHPPRCLPFLLLLPLLLFRTPPRCLREALLAAAGGAARGAAQRGPKSLSEKQATWGIWGPGRCALCGPAFSTCFLSPSPLTGPAWQEGGGRQTELSTWGGVGCGQEADGQRGLGHCSSPRKPEAQQQAAETCWGRSLGSDRLPSASANGRDGGLAHGTPRAWGRPIGPRSLLCGVTGPSGAWCVLRPHSPSAKIRATRPLGKPGPPSHLSGHCSALRPARPRPY